MKRRVFKGKQSKNIRWHILALKRGEAWAAKHIRPARRVYKELLATRAFMGVGRRPLYSKYEVLRKKLDQELLV